MLADRLAQRPLWLITEYRGAQMGDVLILTISGDSVKTLPVFSSKEEAELFLEFEVLGTEWRVRQITPGELISLLYGLCAGVENVLLDPSEEIAAERMTALVSLSRKDFVQTLSDIGGLAGRQRSCLRRSRPSSSVPLELGGGGRNHY